jgi:hypothetical protein
VPINLAKKKYSENKFQMIFLNDYGVYIDDSYYQYFSKYIPDFKLKNMMEFEEFRNKNVVMRIDE